MKYLFLVQGEGRGHMTQAISLFALLKSNGHEIVGVLVGKNGRRNIPDYIFRHFDGDVTTYDSPNFLFNKNRKGIRIIESFIYNLFRLPQYIRSIKKIRAIIKDKKPDIVVNFYDLIGGLYNLCFPHTKSYCIGHQFLLTHPDFPCPKDRKLEKLLLKWHNFISSYKSHKRLALSFRPMKAFEHGRTIVVPPLLRKEILAINDQNIDSLGYLHGYILNDGFASEIIEWHQENNEMAAHIFWDKKEVSSVINDNLMFHQLDDQLFLHYLKNCKFFAGTAGFESLCEAMYLGKPFLCVPSANHYEQYCNALDATNNKAGIWDYKFNINRLIAFSQSYQFDHKSFRSWVNQASHQIMDHLV